MNLYDMQGQHVVMANGEGTVVSGYLIGETEDGNLIISVGGNEIIIDKTWYKSDSAFLL